MAEPCGNQHERRVAIREGDDDSGSPADLANQPFERVVGAQTAPVFRRQVALERHRSTCLTRQQVCDSNGAVTEL